MFFPLESFVSFVVKFLSNEQGSHSKGTNLPVSQPTTFPIYQLRHLAQFHRFEHPHPNQ
jgi:hypothetical protein